MSLNQMGGRSPEASGRVRARRQVGVPAAKPAGSRRTHTARSQAPPEPADSERCRLLSEGIWLTAWTTFCSAISALPCVPSLQVHPQAPGWGSPLRAICLHCIYNFYVRHSVPSFHI